MKVKTSNKKFETVIGTEDEGAYLIKVYVPKHLPLKDALLLTQQIAALSLLTEHRDNEE